MDDMDIDPASKFDQLCKDYQSRAELALLSMIISELGRSVIKVYYNKYGDPLYYRIDLNNCIVHKNNELINFTSDNIKILQLFIGFLNFQRGIIYAVNKLRNDPEQASFERRTKNEMSTTVATLILWIEELLNKQTQTQSRI